MFKEELVKLSKNLRSVIFMLKSYEVLRNPFLNKGTAFTKEEREELGLVGILPSKVQTLEEQTEQAYAQFQSKTSPLEKRIF